MKKANITTTTYQFNDKYYVDIVEFEDKFEAWIYNINYGIKSFVYGCHKDNMTEFDFYLSLFAGDIFYDSIEEYQERFED